MMQCLYLKHLKLGGKVKTNQIILKLDYNLLKLNALCFVVLNVFWFPVNAVWCEFLCEITEYRHKFSKIGNKLGKN